MKICITNTLLLILTTSSLVHEKLTQPKKLIDLLEKTKTLQRNSFDDIIFMSCTVVFMANIFICDSLW